MKIKFRTRLLILILVILGLIIALNLWPSFNDSGMRYYISRDTEEIIADIEPLFYGPLNKDFLEAADRMLKGQYDLPPFGKVDYKNGIKWYENPSYTRSFMRTLHGHFFIEDLVASYQKTRDSKYLTHAYEIIRDWIEKNPFDHPSDPMAWHDETTARRLIVWINFFDVARDILNEEELEILFDEMKFHADLLLDEKFYTPYTNHGMFQDEALLVFSTYFHELDRSQVYKETALKRLDDYFDFIISSEGVHLEHSPSYHQLIASFIKKYADFFERTEQTERTQQYFELYDRMSVYATYIIMPDGTFPLLGDTFGTDQPNSRLWKDNAHYLYSRSGGNQGTPPEKSDMVFPEAGYAIFRDSWDSKAAGTYILFTAAYHTDYHKHSDDLTLWIYSDGEIIVEAGPNGYDYKSPFTQYAYSSFAHNTLIVNGEGLPRVDDKFELTRIRDYKLDEGRSL